jgi:predicted GIY-YIG superfamily endonuclease
MFHVYILRSGAQPTQTYVGFTTDLTTRLHKHNEGGSPHTAKHRPWQLIWSCAFDDKGKALAFEAYLKSHSGKAFAAKRLL